MRASGSESSHVYKKLLLYTGLIFTAAVAALIFAPSQKPRLMTSTASFLTPPRTHRMPPNQTLPVRPADTRIKAPADRPSTPAATIIRRFFVDNTAEDTEAIMNPFDVMHREADSGAPDPAWSPGAERQLTDYLVSRVDEARVEIVRVRCSAKVCEVQAAGRWPKSASTDGHYWHSTVFNPSDQWWWAGHGLGQPSTIEWSAPDGRPIFVSYLVRES